jgi:hypothetical protein
VARIVVSAEGAVDAPAETVYGYIADMREHHPRFLPPAFSDFQVESGGVGAGTVTRYKLTAGGRTREFRAKVESVPLSPGHVDELELDVVGVPEDDHRVGHRIAGVDHT